jgi:hypothetical protein
MRRLTTPPRQDRARPADADGIGNETLAELSAAALRFREEAELRWIDHCILRLRLAMGPQPAAVAAEVAHDVDAVGDAEVAGST